MRLKLYLAIIWIAGGGRGAPFDTSIPARAWAELLDLPDPERNGARRVTDAVSWLDEHGFIDAVAQPGRPARIVLLHEAGDARPYPGAPGSADDPYVRLRSEFWEYGWAAVLSGAAIAMLLLVLDWGGEKRPVWISPDMALRRYSLSEDSRTAGVAELRYHRLISVQRQLVSPDLGVRRMRNKYKANLDRLQETPGS